MKQLDLFEWALRRPSAQIIDILPALCRKAAFEVIYRVPPPKETGKLYQFDGRAA